jgi:hypothetical protein
MSITAIEDDNTSFCWCQLPYEGSSSHARFLAVPQQVGSFITVCCAGTLWLGNAAYLYLSVSFIQMLKALMPVAVFCSACLFSIETFNTSTLINMVSTRGPNQ